MIVDVAENVALDSDKLLGQRTIFQAAPGGGKSSGTRLLLEKTYGRFQQIILDVEDEFHTLRTTEREYAIIGGPNGDAPLGPVDLADHLALTLLKVGVSTILQIGDLTLSDKRAFIGKFVSGLMLAPRDDWHPVLLVLDESHNFVPQDAVVASSEPLIHYSTAGRKRGFGAIFATQRLSLISKDILGACNNKLLGRVEQAADRRAAADQLGFSPKQAEAVEMQAFKPGEFYVVGPALALMPTRARLHRAETEAPPPGTTVMPTATPAAIRKALASIAKASETAVPDASVSPIIAAGATRAELDAAEKRGYERGWTEGAAHEWARGVSAIRAELVRIGQNMLSVVKDATATSRDFAAVVGAIDEISKKPSAAAAGILPAGQVAHAPIVTALEERQAKAPDAPAPKVKSAGASGASVDDPLLSAAISIWPVRLPWGALAALCGRKARGGHFNTKRKALLDAGLLREEAGLVVVANPPTMPEGVIPADILEEKLPQPAGKMFAVIRSTPGISIQQLADRLSMQPRGGHWNTGMSMLRKNALVIEQDSGLAVTPGLDKANG